MSVNRDSRNRTGRGRLARAAGWVMGAALGVALGAGWSAPGVAHDPSAKPTGPGILGHSTGEELKRVPGQTGKGMPSIEGPFPDTVNMEFLGQLTNEELGVSRLVRTGTAYLSDIWGWTSPTTGDEYAIVGTSSGVAFARISDPRNPVFLGIIPTTDDGTQRNFWWDMKTFNGFVYYVTEVRDAGLAIFDMTHLDGMAGPPPGGTLAADARYDANGFRAAHNISINEETGFAYLTGVSKDLAVDPGFIDDGMIILDLNNDPLVPVEVGQVNGRDTHDAQVVCYRGPDPDHQPAGGECLELAFVFNGVDLTVGIYDVSVKQVVDLTQDLSIRIAEATYAGASFTHQGWVTEDHEFMIAGDEEDELFGISDPRNPLLPDTARTYVWNIQDLDIPKMVSFFDSDAAAIDHNLFVRSEASGREFVYQANYTSGIRVTELHRSDNDGDGVAEFAELEEIAHMDTEPRLPNKHMNHNWNIFEGPWGVYPFFGSNSIIASDGLNGLIVMRLDLP